MAIPHEVPSFAVTSHDNQALRDKLPEDASPLWSDAPNVYVWGNQEEYRLRTATHPLGRVAVIGACFANQELLDATLARVLEEQGPEALTCLPGSYVTILQEQDRLTVMRDVAGAFPVYFVDTQEGLAVSSEPTMVTSDGGLRPNIAQAVANLAFLAPNEGAMAANASCFEGVSKLMGGQALTIGRNDHSVYTYESLAPDSTLTHEAAALNLRSALREAVQSRLESGVAASANLSGGVDSSSIVALALESMAPDVQLPVFFMDNPGHESEDKKLFSSYVEQDARLSPNLFDMSGLSHVVPSSIDSPRALNAIANPARELFLSEYYEAIRNAGAGRLHFTGNGGDEVVSVGPYYLPDLLRKGEIGRFLKEGREWARIYNTSPYRMWRAMGVLAVRGPRGALQQAARRVSEYGHDDIGDPVDSVTFWQPDKTALSWLTAESRQALSDYLVEQSSATELNEDRRVGDFIARERIRAAASDQGLEMHNTPAGISLHSPFLDHNVVRAAMAADATRKGSPYEFKLLLREALKGIVPDDILNRPSKGIYGAASKDRHFEALRTLSDLLDDSVLVKLGIIDPKPIRRELGRLEMIPPSTMWALTQVLVTERWLQSINLPDEALIGLNSRIQQTEGGVSASENPAADIAARFSVPEHIYFVSSADGSLLAFNQKTDQYHPLTVTQSNMLRVLSYVGDIPQTIDRLSTVYKNVPREKLTDDMLGIVGKLQSLGVIASGVDATPRILPVETAPRFVSEEFHTARVEGEDRVTWRNKALAGVALMGTELINRVVPQKRKNILRRMQQWTAKPASQKEAAEALLAVQSSRYVGRIACLQASYAAAVALALQGKKADWHMGVSFAPLDIHAWIEAEGEPVRTSKDGRVMGSYQTFFS